MKITNVRWGLMGEPYGQPCLYFDLDGRPASAFWEQKKGVVDNGYLSIDFEDGQPSHLPVVKLYAPDDPNYVVTESNKFIRSPWLMEKFMDTSENGKSYGDAPAEGA